MACVFEVINTASEAQWLAARQKVLTATDIGRIVVAPGEVHRIRKEKQQLPLPLRSKYIWWGKQREADLVVWGRSFADSRLEHNSQLLVSTRDRRVGATPDMVQPGDTPEVIAEIKTSKHPMPDMGDPLRLRGMALRYFVQMQVQLFVTGAQACVLIWEQHDDDWQPTPEGGGFRPTIMGVSSQVIVFNPVFFDEVIAPAVEDYRNYGESRPPVDSTVEVAIKIMRELHLDIQERQEQLVRMRKELASKLGEGTSYETRWGNIAKTRPSVRSHVDMKALKEHAPDLVERFTTHVETKPQLRITYNVEGEE